MDCALSKRHLRPYPTVESASRELQAGAGNPFTSRGCVRRGRKCGAVVRDSSCGLESETNRADLENCLLAELASPEESRAGRIFRGQGQVLLLPIFRS